MNSVIRGGRGGHYVLKTSGSMTVTVANAWDNRLPFPHMEISNRSIAPQGGSNSTARYPRPCCAAGRGYFQTPYRAKDKPLAPASPAMAPNRRQAMARAATSARLYRVEALAAGMMDILGRTRIGSAVLATLWLCLSAAGQQVIVQQDRVIRNGQVTPRNPANVPAKPEIAFLVNADPELASYLSQAQDLAKSGEYAKALDVLQALLNKNGAGFVPAGDGHRYVSLAQKVDETLGGLPADALDLYRRLNDEQARRQMEQASAQRDLDALDELSQRYRRSSLGSEIARRLGALQFDNGQFAPAWRSFEQALTLENNDAAKSLLLARLAVAAHLAGDDTAARAAVERLAKEYPQAQAKLGGAEQNVAQYAKALLASAASQPAGPVLNEWLSYAGSASGLAVSPPAHPVLSPQWVQPEGKVETNPIVRQLVGLTGESFSPPEVVQPGRAMPTRKELRVVEGQLLLKVGQENLQRQLLLPPVQHVLVTDSLVLARDMLGVVAYDLASGKVLWRSLDFPLLDYKSTVAPPDYRFVAVSMQDEGLFGLSSGEGLVFAVGGFAPRDLRRMQAAAGAAPAAANSSMAAFSLARQGKEVWKIGKDNNEGGRVDGASAAPGDSDIARLCDYLTAPTYSDGKLYTTVRFRQAYHLLCLRARDGKMLYSQLISQQPADAERNPFQPEFTTPPVVDGDNVFVLTNAGVVACFHASSGAGLWAYQYDTVNALREMVTSPQDTMVPRSGTAMVADHGRLICMPADSQSVLALDQASGQLLWQVSRAGQVDLTGVPGERVALSGPGLIILRDADGRVLWQDDKQVTLALGRPAVTTDALLLSGRGRVYRLDLADYALSSLPLRQGESPLGNLVSLGGRLIAANAAGIAVYSTYEQARADLSQRIEKSSGDERLTLLYQRGSNSLYAGKPAEAAADFETILAALGKTPASAKVEHGHANGSENMLPTGGVEHGHANGGLAMAPAATPSDSALAVKARQGLFRAYIALGNAASGREQLGWFMKAQALADDTRTRGEMLLRLGRYYEQNGQVTLAVEIAQKLSRDLAEVAMTDAGIGPDARADEPPLASTGYQVGQAMVGEFIRHHGQKVYEAFDQQAASQLESAGKSQNLDAMLRVAKLYSHSVHAPIALLRAAEIQYQLAQQEQGPQRRQMLGLSGSLLQQVIRDYPDSGLGASAYLGMAMIYQQASPQLTHLAWDQIKKLPPSTQAGFAGSSGTLEALTQSLQPKYVEPRPAPPPKDLPLPLAKLWSAPQDSQALLDARGQLTQLGNCFFLLSGGNVVCSQSSAANWKDSILWQMPLRIQAGVVGGAMGPTRAELAGNGTVLCVWGLGWITGFDTRDGRELWSRRHNELMTGLRATTDKELVLLGGEGLVTVLDKANGQQLWQHRIAASDLPWRTAPQLAGGLLLTFHGMVKAGESNGTYTVFDMASRRSLGSVALDEGAFLTPEGLLIGTRRGEVVCIEPLLQMEQPMWTVALPEGQRPLVLGQCGDNVFVSRAATLQTLEMLSISQLGQKVREFSPIVAAQPSAARELGARVGFPITVLGDHLLVMSDELRAFDVSSGKALWSASAGVGFLQGAALTQSQIFLPLQGKSGQPSSVIAAVGLTDGKLLAPLNLSAPAANIHAEALPQAQGARPAAPPVAQCALADGRLVSNSFGRMDVWAPSAAAKPAAAPASAPAKMEKQP